MWTITRTHKTHPIARRRRTRQIKPITACQERNQESLWFLLLFTTFQKQINSNSKLTCVTCKWFLRRTRKFLKHINDDWTSMVSMNTTWIGFYNILEMTDFLTTKQHEFECCFLSAVLLQMLPCLLLGLRGCGTFSQIACSRLTIKYFCFKCPDFVLSHARSVCSRLAVIEFVAVGCESVRGRAVLSISVAACC